jgi:putative ABC transport system permease protein
VTGHLTRLRSRLTPLLGRDPADLAATSGEALGRYKLRTFLSVLGVVLGVAAVIAMMSVSEGARRDVLRQVELMGLGNVVVRARPVTLGSTDGPGRLRAGDAAALRAVVPRLSGSSPLVERPLEAAVGTRRRVVRVVGVDDEYARVLGLRLSRGRFLAALDARRLGRVCVLGGSLSRALFGPADPLGELVRRPVVPRGRRAGRPRHRLPRHRRPRVT